MPLLQEWCHASDRGHPARGCGDFRGTWLQVRHLFCEEELMPYLLQQLQSDDTYDEGFGRGAPEVHRDGFV